MYGKRLADLDVLDPTLDMRGGLPQNEIPIAGNPYVAGSGIVIANGSRWVDSALVSAPGRIKALCIVVDTAITSAGAQQATIQLFAARTLFATLATGVAQPATPFAGAQSAAGSQIPVSPNQNMSQLVGGTVAFAGSVASIPPGVYWFAATSPGNPSASPPTSMTELAQMYPCLGIEITAPAAFTGGSFRAFFELAPI
jgi:hypothetical protein